MNIYFSTRNIFLTLSLVTSFATYGDDKITALQRAQGYNALEHILEQQSNLDKLLLVKGPPQGVKTFVKDMSTYAKAADTRVKEWRKVDPAIVADNPGFPALEVKARANIQSALTKRLLLSVGTNFATRLMVSQIEATEYLSNLSQAILDTEVNPTRKAQLEKDEKVFAKFNDRAFALLSSKGAKSNDENAKPKDETTKAKEKDPKSKN